MPSGYDCPGSGVALCRSVTSALRIASPGCGFPFLQPGQGQLVIQRILEKKKPANLCKVGGLNSDGIE